MGNMLWAIVVILVILWLAGLLFHLLGGAIHLLLILAIIVAVYNVVMGRRAV